VHKFAYKFLAKGGEPMETIVAIGVAIGLSAACGFRVFVPPLAIGLLP
jgi:hypothetical protein